MEIHLQTNSENPSLTLLGIKRFDDDSGFRALLVVLSGKFTGEYEFYFEPGPLKSFIKALEKMDSSLSGTARLQPLYEPQFIEFECASGGHVIVRGELPEHSELQQKLIFEFHTDQTVLKPFISALQAVQTLCPAQPLVQPNPATPGRLTSSVRHPKMQDISE